MNRRLKHVSLLCSCVCLLALSSFAEKDKKEGKVGEFTIKGKASMDIESKKPPLAIKVDKLEPLKPSLGIEPGFIRKTPSQINEIKEVVPSMLASDHVVSSSFLNIVDKDIVAEFYPLAELKKAYDEPAKKRAKKVGRWDFKAADAQGDIFVVFEGEGLPPETVSLPRKNKKGKWIQVGNPYSGVLRYWDSQGNIHTAITDPIEFTGIVYESFEGSIINLSYQRLFASFDAKMTKKGKQLVKEASDWIKAQRGHAAVISVKVHSSDKARSNDQAKQIANMLAKELMRDKYSVSSKGLRSDLNLGFQEKVEITVTLQK
ncbi:hypothetical protein ACFL6Y_06970 [Elusimicrobiota bacterium]